MSRLRRSSAYRVGRSCLAWVLILQCAAVIGLSTAMLLAEPGPMPPVIRFGIVLASYVIALPFLLVEWTIFHALFDIADSFIRHDLHGVPSTVSNEPFGR